MSISRQFQRLLAPFAQRLGLEIIPLRDPLRDLSLKGALSRIRRHEIEVACVIDVGASNGRWSREVLPDFPQSRFLLIDALEERRNALERFCAEHPQVQFEIAAAGEAPGEINYHVAHDLDGSGVAAGTGAYRKVPVIPLDDLVQRHRLRGPYFLKLDTHGFEVPIFAGACSMLAETNLIMVEVYNFQLTPLCLRFHETCSWLEARGFRCFDMVDPYLRPYDGAFWQMDLLFTRADHPIFQHQSYA